MPADRGYARRNRHSKGVTKYTIEHLLDFFDLADALRRSC